MENIYSLISRNIKLRRTEANLKQCELADKINCSKNHISSIEHGYERPSFECLLKLCIELDCNPNFLLLNQKNSIHISQPAMQKLKSIDTEYLILIQRIIEILICHNSSTWNDENQVF